MTVDEVLERKRALTEQLRRIDEAFDTATGERDAEPEDLPLVLRRDGHDADKVKIGETWIEFVVAEELTRAGLHECDVVLDEAGAFG